MNAAEMGSDDWWLVVLSMPNYEAMQQLTDYRSALMSHKAGTPEHFAAGHKLIRVNAEIKRINKLIDDSRWYRACKDILTPEQFDEVFSYKRHLEDAP